MKQVAGDFSRKIILHVLDPSMEGFSHKLKLLSLVLLTLLKQVKVGLLPVLDSAKSVSRPPRICIMVDGNESKIPGKLLNSLRVAAK